MSFEVLPLKPSVRLGDRFELWLWGFWHEPYSRDDGRVPVRIKDEAPAGAVIALTTTIHMAALMMLAIADEIIWDIQELSQLGPPGTSSTAHLWHSLGADPKTEPPL